MANDYDVAIAGAGIVGMSAALWAQLRGLRVAIYDPNPPGSGATFGPACAVATYACVPINAPSIVTSLPGMLFSQDSPLALNYGYAFRNWRWMLSFLMNCRPGRVESIGASLGALLRHANDGLDPLIAEAGAEDLLVQQDCLYVWSSRRGYESAAGGNRLRAAQGVEMEELSPGEVRALEPGLKLPVHRGLRFPGTRVVLNPQKLVERMHSRFVRGGGKTLADSVRSVRADEDGVSIRLSGGQELRAAHFVVAAGAHSKGIEGAGVSALPLGVERGYHVTFSDHRGKLSRPVGWAEAGLYATPMARGLRIAGTVELDDLQAPPNAERLEFLRRRATEMLGPMDGPREEWLGFRPTMPDALPVIGPSKVSGRIIHAFGHQHIGLTLGGITGRMVADIVTGQAPTPGLSGLTDDRFS